MRFGKRVRPDAIVIAICLIANTLLLGWGASRHSPNWDEIGHLPAGLSHLELGSFELYAVNPPLVRTVAALPVSFVPHKTSWQISGNKPGQRNEFTVGIRFLEANQFRSFWLFALARWACIPFSWLGAWGCYLWARDLYGRRAGVVAVAIWSFSPSVLAYGQMITPAIGATAFGCIANYAFWRWLKHPSWKAATITGVAFGLTLLTKTTWLILFGLWPLVWCCWRWKLFKATDRLERPVLIEIAQLLAILGLGIYLVNFGYLFDGSLRPLGEYEFVSETLSEITADEDHAKWGSNRFRGTWLASVPVPFPQKFVEGIDLQKRDFEMKMWSYLRGEWRRGGWWYYYLYAMLVKMPIGTHMLIAFGLLALLFMRTNHLEDELVLLAPTVLVLILVSSQTGFNHHLRYVFPAFPGLYVLASKAFSSHMSRSVHRVAVTALVAMICSSVFVWPHSRSYFNEAIGGPINGHNHLGGSFMDTNVDCGQDLLFLREWIDAQPKNSKIYVLFNGAVSPKIAGVDKLVESASRIESVHSNSWESGQYAISVNLLHDRQGRLDYFRNQPVRERIGYSINVYCFRSFTNH